jgi:hypothetical protein
MHRTIEIHIHHALEERQIGQLFKQADCTYPGIVDEHVEVPKCAHGLLAQRLALLLIGHVDRHGDSFAPTPGAIGGKCL